MREMATNVKRDSFEVVQPVSPLECAMLLASDIGGTKTLIGLFSSDPDRPSPIEVGEFATLDYDGLEPMVREFLGVWKVDPHDYGDLHRRRGRRDGSGRTADERAVARRRGSGRHDTGAQARRGHQRPRGARLRGAVLEPTELAVLQQGIASPAAMRPSSPLEPG